MPAHTDQPGPDARLTRQQVAWRAAQDLADGNYVNLGIGLPVLVANYAPENIEVIFQSENGIVGVGPVASDNMADPDLVDAGSQRVTLRPGGAIVDSAAAFAMIRGGHIDLTLLGGFEVASNGDFANWDLGASPKGQLVGGAMDLAAGAKDVRVLMTHTTKTGAPRLLERCNLSLTAVGVVKRVYTDLAVLDIRDGGFVVRQMVPTMTEEALQNLTGAPLVFDEPCGPLICPDLS
ncbi:MAG: 3-oxoacid CoA-transferase subunit B [Gammaproteobacteria bacterium]|nr:3-oxoacid CoA-transferase subunit B [Gammaproteobacteria bacterium]